MTRLAAFLRVLPVSTLLIGWSAPLAAQLDPGVASRVVVVANAACAESKEVAEHYLQRRGIPRENLVLLEAPTDETISWDDYLQAVHNPLVRALHHGGWLQGLLGSIHDSAGRLRTALEGHRIDYLVLSRNLPLRIRHDGGRVSEQAAAEVPDQFRRNRGSVEAQLALIPLGSRVEITGYVPNPLFRQQAPTAAQRQAVIRVARLDGPSVAAVKRLIDGGIQAERTQLWGRAFIDLGGPHTRGDEWLRGAADRLENAGLPVVRDTRRAAFAPSTPMDGLALYFGWYAEHVEGPFAIPGFRALAGAIGFHIHSFSATTVRSDQEYWVGPLVEAGVMTVGNVYEPYLELTHHPDLMVEALLGGSTLGEAAFYALPALGWQAVLIGDPLYRPFAEGRRPAELAERLPGPVGAVVRARRLVQEGAVDRAAELLGEAQQRRPHPTLAIELGRLNQERGEPAQARQALRFFRELASPRGEVLALAIEAAGRLTDLGDDAAAIEIYAACIKNLPTSSWRSEVIERARDLAFSAGDMARYRAWSELLKDS
ncbi:MAG: TIGR03790 family protein [Puniceicoccaceae bacterium]|nr:MAG: TIGR03790 family protein [Puniceicoccaceae bacterium]